MNGYVKMLEITMNSIGSSGRTLLSSSMPSLNIGTMCCIRYYLKGWFWSSSYCSCKL